MAEMIQTSQQRMAVLVTPQDFHGAGGQGRQGSQRQRVTVLESLIQPRLLGVGVAALKSRVALLMVKARLDERLDFPRRRQPQSLHLQFHQLRVQALGGFHRLGHQVVVGYQQPRDGLGMRQPQQTVLFPERQPQGERKILALVERLGDLDRAAMDVDADWRFQQRFPERQQQVDAGILEHPRAAGVQIEQNLLRLRAKFGYEVRPDQALGVETADPIPGPAQLAQHILVQAEHVPAFPVAFLIVIVGRHGQFRRREVRAHHVEQASYR